MACLARACAYSATHQHAIPVMTVHQNKKIPRASEDSMSCLRTNASIYLPVNQMLCRCSRVAARYPKKKPLLPTNCQHHHCSLVIVTRTVVNGSTAVKTTVMTPNTVIESAAYGAARCSLS